MQQPFEPGWGDGRPSGKRLDRGQTVRFGFADDVDPRPPRWSSSPPIKHVRLRADAEPRPSTIRARRLLSSSATASECDEGRLAGEWTETQRAPEFMETRLPDREHLILSPMQAIECRSRASSRASSCCSSCLSSLTNSTVSSTHASAVGSPRRVGTALPTTTAAAAPQTTTAGPQVSGTPSALMMMNDTAEAELAPIVWATVSIASEGASGRKAAELKAERHARKVAKQKARAEEAREAARAIRAAIAAQSVDVGQAPAQSTMSELELAAMTPLPPSPRQSTGRRRAPPRVDASAASAVTASVTAGMSHAAAAAAAHMPSCDPFGVSSGIAPLQGTQTDGTHAGDQNIPYQSTTHPEASNAEANVQASSRPHHHAAASTADHAADVPSAVAAPPSQTLRIPAPAIPMLNMAATRRDQASSGIGWGMASRGEDRWPSPDQQLFTPLLDTPGLISRAQGAEPPFEPVLTQPRTGPGRSCASLCAWLRSSECREEICCCLWYGETRRQRAADAWRAGRQFRIDTLELLWRHGTIITACSLIATLMASVAAAVAMVVRLALRAPGEAIAELRSFKVVQSYILSCWPCRSCAPGSIVETGEDALDNAVGIGSAAV